MVLDSNGRFPETAKLNKNPNLLVATCEASDAANYVTLPRSHAGQIDLPHLLQYLVEQEDCSEVLFECGATLAGSLLEQDLVDELIVYIAPKLMGADARSLVNIGSLTEMDQVKEFSIQEVRSVGSDLRVILKRTID